MSDHVPVNILFYALEEDLAHELEGALSQRSFPVNVPHGPPQELAGPDPNVVFCGFNRGLIRGLREKYAQAAIIVISRFAEVSDWIDAIEAGADDYYAAPFESSHVDWMIASGLRSRRHAA